MPSSAIFADVELPSGGSLKEALRAQALANLFNPTPATIERTVE